METILVKHMIKENTIGANINIMGIAKRLSIEIKVESNLNDLGKVYIDKNENVIISLNENSDKQTKYTLMVIAVADYILTPTKIMRTGIVYDMFFLNDIFAHRHSYRMLLATRLAFPEHIIDKLCSNSGVESGSFSYADFIANSNYLSQFIRSCIDDSSALFLLKNTSELPI